MREKPGVNVETPKEVKRSGMSNHQSILYSLRNKQPDSDLFPPAFTIFSSRLSRPQACLKSIPQPPGIIAGAMMVRLTILPEIAFGEGDYWSRTPAGYEKETLSIEKSSFSASLPPIRQTLL
jgi:hypothetical protein